MSYLDFLECSLCSRQFDPGRIWNICPDCAKPLLARYNLARARKSLNRESFQCRQPNMWRYSELMPVCDPANILTLGEGFTPLRPALKLQARYGAGSLHIKDEGINPTTSFKARGLSTAVSRARELGIKELSIPSAGNAGGAMSAYAALGGMRAHVFMPIDVPLPFIAECEVHGASVHLIDGLISDCGRAAAEELVKHNRFDVSTFKEPYRLEGKKTMGYELAEQMDWSLPDVIIYPTGGGTGLVGMWKAFSEMEELGWIGSKRPRMVSVQSQGCAPIVAAFDRGDRMAPIWPDASTIADGIRVPSVFADSLILDILTDSSGTAIAVSDSDIIEAMLTLGRLEGIFAAPEGAATLVAYEALLEKQWLGADESVILFNTGSGYKYSQLMDRRNDKKKGKESFPSL